jgi:ParB family chromosome partitioning protein
VSRNELTEGHARAVLSVPDHEGRRRLARRIVKEGLSVRAAERAARFAGARTKERRATTVDPALATRITSAVRRLTGLDAKVGAAGLHIPVEGEVALEELAEALERLAGDGSGSP